MSELVTTASMPGGTDVLCASRDAAKSEESALINETETCDNPSEECITGDANDHTAAGTPCALSADLIAKASISDITGDAYKEETHLISQDAQVDNLASQAELSFGGRPLRVSKELPQFSLSVQSNQADLESLCAGLDNSLEPQALHLQALSCNTDGQSHFANKRVLVSILSEGYAPVRATDPTDACLNELFGLDIDVMCVKGQKEGANQDNWSVSQTFFNNSGEARLTLFCVLDGHGPQGHVVSARLSQSLPSQILPRLLSSGDLQATDIGAVMRDAFAAAQRDLISCSSQQQLSFDSSGSTVLIGLRMPFDSKAHIAWVGDVQAAEIASEPLFVSTAHLPIGGEAERVKLAGGDVIDKGPGLDGGPLFRVYRKGETAPGLAISRALGDFAAVEAGVICEPEHAVVSADAGNLLVFASDGIWDFVDAAEFVDLRGEEGSAKSLAQRVVELALGRRAGRGLPCDDATCVIWSI